jgi:adenosylcobinamide kinase / adenosylcobinamide-phosphate guanylyltransferase
MNHRNEDVRQKFAPDVVPNWAVLSGGARSGKSQYALATAQGFAKTLWIATANAKQADEELLHRITLQQLKRQTLNHELLEANSFDLSSIRKAKEKQFDFIVLDCLTLLLAEEVSRSFQSYSSIQLHSHLAKEMDQLIRDLQSTGLPVLIVTNDAGEGVVPNGLAGRVFRDALGEANQKCVSLAHCFVKMISGIPLVLKGQFEHETQQNLINNECQTPLVINDPLVLSRYLKGN